MSASKIDHKELQKRLKEDDLALYMSEFSSSAKTFYEQYGKTAGLVILLIAVLVAGYFVWQKKSASDFATSQILYGNAVGFMSQERYDLALQELGKLTSNYSGSDIAAPALVLRGDCYFKSGQFDLALKEYQAALPNLSPADALLAQTAIVQSHRSLNNPDQALAVLDSLSPSQNNKEVENQIKYLRGACLEDKDQKDQALEAYLSIDPESAWFAIARERIDWLKAPEVGAIN